MALAGVVLWLLAAPAWADARQKVLFLKTEGTTVADAVRQGVATELFAQAQRYKQLEVAVVAAELSDELFVFECTEASVECLGKIGTKYGAQLVVYSEVVKAGGGNLQLKMRVIDVGASRVAQSTNPDLDGDKPGAAIARGLVVLLGPVELNSSDTPGKLRVALLGGGPALVYVDDQLAGKTTDRDDIALPSGTHTVRVVRAGFREWSGKVTIPAGGRIERLIKLEQMASVPAAQTPLGAAKQDGSSGGVLSQWWFWPAVGVGVLGVAVGVWAATRSSDAPATGAMSFTFGSDSAHLDPVFSAGAP